MRDTAPDTDRPVSGPIRDADAPFVHVETPEIPALPVAGTRARWRLSPAPPIVAWRGLLAWLRRSDGTWWGESIGAVCAIFLFLMIMIAGGILQ